MQHSFPTRRASELHIFIRPRLARQDADDVVRRGTADRIVEPEAGLEPERHRPEAFLPGGGGKRGKVLAGGFQDRFGHWLLYPAVGGGDRKSTRLNSSH